MAQKIRCLRAAGRHAEASALVLLLNTVQDDLGEREILTAAREMGSGRYAEALQAVERAKLKPKVNRVNLRLLEAAIRVEMGDTQTLDDTCKIATAVGRNNAAHSLRARAHLKSKDWKAAEEELRRIPNTNYYDKQLIWRCLDMKRIEPAIRADPVVFRAVMTEFDKLTVELMKEKDGAWLDFD